MKKNIRKHKVSSHDKKLEKISETEIEKEQGDIIESEPQFSSSKTEDGNESKENLIDDAPTEYLSKENRNRILVFTFLLVVLGSYAVSFQKKASAKNEAGLKGTVEKYIKDNLVQSGTELKITDFAKEGNLYKFTVEVGGQKVVSYLTGDGKRLLLNPIDLDGKSDTPAADSNAAPAKAVEASQKKDIPEVELFVMSLCPYGIQAEKGILPVVEKLGSKINFAVKFVDYTLHGKKEFDENLNQYCIQKEEPAKFNDYLSCYAKSGDNVACATAAKIDDAKIASCISAADKEFKLTENFSANAQSSPFNIQKDLNDKYGVQGSPSLVVNGQLLDAGRDSASLLKTICSGFSNQPEECKAELSATSPTPGFGG